MKKLLVLSLTVVMVLAFAAVSMAATVTVGGELNFGKNFEANSNISAAKVVVTAQIADDVKAGIALLADPTGNPFACDDAYVTFTEDYGTITIKKGDYNKADRDIVNNYVGAVGTAGLTVVYETKLSDQITLDVVASNMVGQVTPGLEYGATLAYDSDSFGINGSLFRNNIAISDFSYLLCGYVKFDAIKVFLNYGDDKSTPATKMLVVGGTYDSADVPFYARAEYDFEQHANTNNWGIRVGYKVTGNYKFEYQYKHDATVGAGDPSGNNNAQYLKLNVTF